MTRLLWLAQVTITCVLAATVAQAHVIDPRIDPANATLRADIDRRIGRYTSCLLTAAARCEAGSPFGTIDCHLDTGRVDYDLGGPAQDRFVADIARCDARLDLSKKGNDYVGIGCPGDCGSAPGVQPCSDIPAFQATVTGTDSTSLKARLDSHATTVALNCAFDTGFPQADDPAYLHCVTQNLATLSLYLRGLSTCERKCQNDFKGRQGDGGPSNGPDCDPMQFLPPTANPKFVACDTAALASAVARGGPLSLTNTPSPVLIKSMISIGAHELYDRADPTSSDPAASPCGTCGNGTREGAEACDGAAPDGLCAPGLCQPDCTCAPPPECSATTGGFCWFLGSDGESCDAACANEFRAYDPATELYAGSGGTDANCLLVLNALPGLTSPFGGVLFNGASACGGAGLGCLVTVDPNLLQILGYRCTDPTTSTAAAPGIFRVCACQ